MDTSIKYDLNMNADGYAAIGDSTLHELLIEALEKKASDVHLTVALPPMMRVNGQLEPMRDYMLMPEHTERLCMQMLTDRHKEELAEKGEVDFSYAIPNVSRFRVNVYKQRRS